MNNLNVKLHILAPLTALVVLFLWFMPTEWFGIEGLTIVQQRTIAIFAYAALMWMFEIIPAWATSVTTIVLLLLAVSNKGFVTAETSIDPETGEKVVTYLQGSVVDFKAIMASFADPIIMLFLGGFVLAIAASKVGLDVVLARVMLKPFGTNPKWVLLGFLTLISVMSMFMSNTATAAMMLAFLAPVLRTLPADGGGRVSLAMAIPIAANIGGLGTPIGTPPNAIAIGQLASMEDPVNIGFGAWMIRFVPVVIIMILFAWWLLQFLFPFKAKDVKIVIQPDEHHTIGWEFWVVTVTFIATILLWMTGELTHLNSNVVALIPFAVFALVGIFKRDDFAKIDWHVLWMVAGGFAIGTALNKTGLAAALVEAIPFGSWSAIVVLIAAGLLGWLLSNFIANSSAANLLVPILAVVGTAMSEQLGAFGGVTTLLVCVAASTSFAMLLPISTPPNAIACSTGLIETKDMTKVGLIVGLVGIALAYAVIMLFPF
ncbi:MAG: SLC13/DASS family transporter [Paludibacteraceae bacterium]|nr:SLC13/DASS family transporter [Paludibacteraceae bacterium]MBQ2608645.1 SLC13/DASS family transporter [Paludibacteraceae bacterium]